MSVVITLLAALAAGQTLSVPAPAGPAALPALERWVSESLEIPIEPGKTEEWASESRELLRSEPTLPLDEALGRSFVKVHRLSGERADRARSLLAGRGLNVLPGRKIEKLLRTPHGLYSFSDAGLEHFDGERWAGVRRSIRMAHGVYEDEDGKLLVGDGGRVYEVEGGRDELVIDAVGRFRFGPYFRHEGVSYLSASNRDRSPALYVKSDGPWTLSPLAEQLGVVGRMTLLDGRLYAGTSNGVFRKEGDEWKPLLTGVGSTNWILAHDGKLYARTWQEKEEKVSMRLYRFDGNEPVRLFPWSEMAFAVRRIGRNLTGIVDGKLHELLPSGWTRVLEGAGDALHSAAEFGDEAYMQTQTGIYRGLHGSWTRIFEEPLSFGEVFEHMGRRWMTTERGLASLSGGRLEIAVPGPAIKGGAVADGRDLLLGTDQGVQRLMFGPEELPSDWREKVLEQLVQRRSDELGASEPFSAGDADGAIHRSGRTVFNRLDRGGK